MKPLNLSEVTQYIQGNIGIFHQRRALSLHTLKLRRILKNKNPYLFRAKNVQTSEELVRGILNAHISSQEEGIFGAFLEGLAIFVCNSVYGGRKSAAEGIDLEFEKDDIIYIVTIKSGPNWANGGQITNMKADFVKAKRILRTSTIVTKRIVAVNGCCYGRDNNPDKGEYLKLCGQEFWELISANERLYVDIIEPLNSQAKERSKEFNDEYLRVLNAFVIEFQRDFCDGIVINWEKLAEFNSGKAVPNLPRRPRQR